MLSRYRFWSSASLSMSRASCSEHGGGGQGQARKTRWAPPPAREASGPANTRRRDQAGPPGASDTSAPRKPGPSPASALLSPLAGRTALTDLSLVTLEAKLSAIRLFSRSRISSTAAGLWAVRRDSLSLGPRARRPR